MSLHDAPLLYIFYDTASLPGQREFFEDILDLQVIENQFHPPHEYHGLVKYDGDQIILSLNLAKEPKFKKGRSDGMITVMAVDNERMLMDRLLEYGYTPLRTPEGVFTDHYGHHYIFRNTAPALSRATRPGCPAVLEVRLIVNDLAASTVFYRDRLGLEVLEQSEDGVRFATGTIDIVIQEGDLAPDGCPIHYHTCLPVFYTADIFETRDALIARGLVFKSARVGISDIGHTVRFIDPSGHIFCLYQPSEESLTWGSGPKVREIASQGTARMLTSINVPK